jgi:hypothetical protein
LPAFEELIEDLSKWKKAYREMQKKGNDAEASEMNL